MRRIWLAAAGMTVFLASTALAQDAGWSRYDDTAAGYSVELPLGQFEPSQDSSPAAPVFREIGGEGQINLYQGDAGGMSLADFAARFSQDDPSRLVSYQAQGQSWFVLSGMYQAGESAMTPLIFYTKVLLSADRQRFSGFEISYPAADKARFDPIVERLEDSFRRPR